MEYRPFGRTGLEISALTLGAMNFGDGRTDMEESYRILTTALDAGINAVDTADSYGQGTSEEVLGQVLARSGRRDELLVATKCSTPMGTGRNDRGTSRRHILRAVEGSLRRLGTDRIDLYQMHRAYFDIAPDETLRALDDLVTAGKVLYVGCSTHPAWFIAECRALSEARGWVRFVSEQPPYNLLDRRIELELLPYARRHDLAILPWSPLAGGILAGRYRTPGDLPEGSRAQVRPWVGERINEQTLGAVEALRQLAEPEGLTVGQLALLWVKDQPGVTSPLLGPRTAEQLAESLVVGDRALDDEVRIRCDDIVAPGTFETDFLNNSGWMPSQTSISDRYDQAAPRT